ncbi:hypothetical protein ACSFE6_07880 [Pseudomonas baetica]|uniref:hypothetical protein n=1 Tax=Pseudomonas baetica TaxID=674054 RepID=UPI003EEE6797
MVMTKSGGFLAEIADYVVAKRAGVTDGYGQGSAAPKKMTTLEAPVLLGCSEACYFWAGICYGDYDKRALLHGAGGGIM